MSGGIHRFPWTSQPQTLTPLNPAYKAIGAYTPITSAALNQAKKYPSLAATNAPTVGAGPAGLQWNLNGSSQYFSANLGAAQLEGFTIIAVGTPTNVATGGAIVTIADTTLAQGSYGLRINAGVVGAYAYSTAGAFNESTHAVAAVNNRTYVFGAVFASTALRTVYLNGTPGTPNTTSGAVTSASQFSIGVLNRSGITQYWPGGVNGVFVLPWALTDAEMARMKTPADVWAAMFAPLQRTIWVPAAAGGVSGTLATTNANDTSAATGTTTVTGTLAKTNANDTSSASGTTTVTGTLATTNANDSVTASGDVGGNITGTVNYTNANDTSAASGTTTVTGSLAKTNANDSVSASGTTTVTGSLARTNANDSVVASGAAGTVTGTVNVTNSNDTADAYGIGAPNNDSGDGSMSRKRYYLRRKGKILLFDTAAQADDYIEAEEEAQKAIAAAKSRGAKKRIAAKILKAVEPIESVEIAPLQELVKAYSVPVNLPQLLTQQDYQQVMDVRAMIQRIQDDEDDELLLLLA